MSRLLAGVGRSDISPAPGTPQGGWGAQTHQRGLGNDLPFYATALVLESGGLAAAIVEADAIGFDGEWTDRILQAISELSGIPRERVRFSCSHTHAGPNTFRLSNISEGLDMALSYLEGLPRRIAGAVWQARQNLKPVRVAAGEGRAEISENRRLRLPDGRLVVGRNPQGPADPTVRVVRFDDLDEKPVATLVHYSCHATTIAWQSRYATPDYPGVVRRVVEEQLGGTCLFLQGAAGSVGPKRGFTGDLNVYRRLGTILGLEAAKVALALETLPRAERLTGVQPSGAAIALYEDVPVEPEPPVLRMVSRPMQLPLKPFPPPEEIEAEAEALRREMNRLRAGGTEDDIRLATALATQAGMRAERARLYHGRTHVSWPLQGIRAGPVALLSMPGEPFVEIGMEIAARSPFRHTLFSGYSNGGFGYIPVRTAYEEGGYEVETTPFAPEAAEVVVREALQVLEELAAPGPRN